MRGRKVRGIMAKACGLVRMIRGSVDAVLGFCGYGLWLGI